MKVKLEICANSFTSALAAQNGGAHRVELCENMAEGGTTPSYAQIKLCKQELSIEVWPIIRPRGGDFLYSDLEFNLMKEDIEICKSLNCDGIVMGVLTPNGDIDKIRCAEIIELAKPMPVAFHRAFDMTNDLFKALADLIELGVVRVLTSGAANTAIQGVATLQKLVVQAQKKIQIMPGAGVNPQNIGKILSTTGATNIHASARVNVASKMKFRNQKTKMGTQSDEYQYQQTSSPMVRQLIENISNF